MNGKRRTHQIFAPLAVITLAGAGICGAAVVAYGTPAAAQDPVTATHGFYYADPDNPVALRAAAHPSDGRAAAMLRPSATSPWPSGSTPTAPIVEKFAKLQQAEASRLYLRVSDLTDLDHLELIATEAARQLP